MIVKNWLDENPCQTGHGADSGAPITYIHLFASKLIALLPEATAVPPTMMPKVVSVKASGQG